MTMQISQKVTSLHPCSDPPVEQVPLDILHTVGIWSREYSAESLGAGTSQRKTGLVQRRTYSHTMTDNKGLELRGLNTQGKQGNNSGDN